MAVMKLHIVVGTSLDTNVSDGEKISRLRVSGCPVIKTCRVHNCHCFDIFLSFVCAILVLWWMAMYATP